MSKTGDAVQAWEALFRAQVSVMRDLRLAFADQGMSMNEYDVLFNIAREPGGRIRLKDLNQNVLLTQSSVSRLIDRFVARGFLHKQADPQDARGAIVELTPAGAAEFRRVARVHMKSIQSRLAVLDTEDLAKLTALCTRLLTPCDEHHDDLLAVVNAQEDAAIVHEDAEAHSASRAVRPPQ